jgi:phosphoglycolate phosphatase
MPDLKAILFDLDGTLIDSLADLAEAVNRMLDDNGYPRRDQKLFPEFIGDGMAKLVERALPEDARTQERIEECLAGYQKHYQKLWKSQTRVYDGIQQAIDHLKGRDLRVGCISNKPHLFTVKCCSHFFPMHTFSVVFGQRDSVPRKPDPAAAIEASEILDLPIEQCAYVGDSGVDMDFAKSAGMLAVGAEWGFRSAKELRDHGADLLVKKPVGLVAALDPDED